MPASWVSWGPEPPSEANTVVTGRDFTLVDLSTDKINERKYDTASPESTDHYDRKDLWAKPNVPEARLFQHRGSPREVPCLQCASRMMVHGFHSLCCDHLANASGKCYCCVRYGWECGEVPETAFKSAYELQVCARKMDEGHEGTDWEYLCGKAELALMKEGLLWFARQDTNDYWDGRTHVKEVINDKASQVDSDKPHWNDGTTNWDGNDNVSVNTNLNANSNQVDNGKYYWDVKAGWNVNSNSSVNQAENDNTTGGSNDFAHWCSKDDTTWGGKGYTKWGEESDSDKGCGTESTPDPEVGNECDDDSSIDENIEFTPESSTDKIVDAINRNTNVVADLCEIMEGIKEGLDRLHEDNVQSKKVLQKILTEQRTLGENQR